MPITLRRLAVRRLVLATLVAGLVIAACSSDDAGPAAGDVTTSTSAAGTDVPTGGDPGLGPDLTRVTGTIAAGSITGTIDGLVSLPVALDVASRGGGNGAIVNRASVGGASSSLVWDGGRPVTLGGDGQITLPSGDFRLGDGIHLSLTDTAILLPAGAYRLDGPHAVGDDSGLATPSDGTSFTTTDGASLSGTGAVEARLAPGVYLFLGPGSLDVTGTLTVQTDTGATQASHVVQSSGSYEVTLTVADDGSITGEFLLGGTVTAE